MATEYKLRVLDTSGTLKAEITDFLTLTYQKKVNASGILVFTLEGENDAIQYLTDKVPVEVWRKNDEVGIAWTKDFTTLFRDGKSSEINQIKRFAATCIGVISFLNWRIVCYPTSTTNLSTFSSKKAEYIMKQLVEFNCGPSATTGNDRKRNGAITGFTVEADGNNGNTLDWNCHGKNVLSELQELALVGGGDFDVVSSGAASWSFKYYDGQLGTDRTATVIFSQDRGNMGDPSHEKLNSKEKTIACVWGRGEKDERDYVSVTGSNYLSTNDIEVYVDARETETGALAYYQAKGNAKLQKTKATEDFKFDILQTPASLYGKHYFMGDLVTAEYDDITASPKIISITVNYKPSGKEDIKVGLNTRYD